MHFTLLAISKEGVQEYNLPSVNDRKVKLLLNFPFEAELFFEVYDNVWSIIGDGELYINGEPIGSHRLKDGDMIRAYPKRSNEFVIRVFERNSRFTEYLKYDIRKCTHISIGRNENKNIFINDKFIGENHAEIVLDHSSAYIVDNSINGIFVNKIRVNGKCELRPFDIIHTVGFKMVYLGDVLAMNRKDIVQCNLTPFDVNDVQSVYEEKIDNKFTRSPRSIEPLYTDPIEIEQPPQAQKLRRQPLIFVVGPSVTMPLPIVMSTLINTQLNSGMSTSNMYIATITSVVMSALIGTGWALAHHFYDKNDNKKNEAFRVEAYKEYIQKNIEFIEQKQGINDSILLSQFLSSENIVQKIRSDNSFIWNRNVRHGDFLCVRTGIGTIDFQAPINVPKQRFSMNKDNMTELPYELAEKYKHMHNSVTQLSIADKNIIGMVGIKERCNDVLNSLIVQITALHSYTDVRLAVFFDNNETDFWSWTRFLPHTFGSDMKIRMVANDPTSYSNVLYDINEVIRSRTDTENENKTIFPHYIIVCTNREIFDADPIEKYYANAADIGFTFIFRSNETEDLPNECHTIIECSETFTGVYDLEKSRSMLNSVKLDTIDLNSADRYARSLGKLRVKAFSSGEIPGSIDYFDMIGIGNLEQWELIKKYKENRAYEGISSFLGIGMGGKPVYLDIHEKKYGPHGLVAGTTGSGKSEILQTFILSLAMNYHPEEVSFILIDFKGGGMANAFVGMPHIAGTITNLDNGDSDNGEAIDPNITRRALVSIKSENARRQSIFKKYGLNKIDDYMKLYREGKADEPLPHLIIISDEFAELKHQQPEFIKELVSVAAIGRSLGVHLILATQKPGNSVDESIKANSRFKLCLRVQDRQDSMEMLQRPDAAFIKHTGRAYLQIGNDEVYEQFQTGYSGSPYIPKDAVNDASDADVAMLTIDGRPLVSRKKVSEKTNVPSELKSAIDFIIRVCNENSIKTTRQLWMPVIPGIIIHEQVIEKYRPSREGINAIYGIVDYPEVQQQFAASIDFLTCTNLMIVSLAGMGKTTLLQTLLYSLAEQYTPSDVNFYILDFSGSVFKAFDILPHTGIVAGSDDTEAVTRTFRFIENVINERKQLFTNADVGSFNEYIKQNKIPLILLVIDNYVNFTEQFENMTDDFTRISRECTKYGIQVIITCNHMSDVRSRVKQNFADIMTGILGDKSEYREGWGVPVEFLPCNMKGRGLTLVDGRLLEYQIALPVDGEDESARIKNMRSMFAEIADRMKEYAPAHRIRILPKDQTNEEFIRKNASENFIPIGYAVRDISVYGIDLDSAFCYAVSDTNAKGVSLVFTEIYRYVKLFGVKTYTIKLRDKVKIHSSYYSNAVTDQSQFREFMNEFFPILKERSALREQLRAEHPDEDVTKYMLEKVEKIFLIIDSLSELQILLNSSDENSDIVRVLKKTFLKGESVGIYIFAGFDQDLYTQFYYTDISKAFASHKSGIHLGGCYDKQKLFDVQMPIAKMSQQEDHYMGYTEENGSGRKIFIPFN